MKRVKQVLISIICTLLILLPFATVYTIAVYLPSQYDNTFVGELDEKYDRLHSIKEEKIVIVGGSSVAFGIDSALIEKYTGMPVVNFGLYAALGTKLMLDLSEDGIGEGDLVVIAPELDAQTFSLYFNTETTLQAFDGNFYMMRDVKEANLFSLLSGMWSLSKEKIRYMLSDEKPNPDGVYNSKNFNEQGDVVYNRDENVMHLYYDPNVLINPDPCIISDEFIDYVNKYIKVIRSKGAKVVFSFCPMNEMGMASPDYEAGLELFSEVLREKLLCPVISEIGDYVYDAGYFYDTNFHLNDSGVRLHTVNLIEDILLELGIPTLVKEDVPEAPALPAIDLRWFDTDTNAEYFIFEKNEDGSYKTVGLTEQGRQMKILTLPLGYDTYKVVTVGEGTFENALLEELVIPENTNVRIFETGAFNKANKLSDIWIYYPIAENILPPVHFSGIEKNLTVHIPEDSNYASDYYWSERGLKFKKDIE